MCNGELHNIYASLLKKERKQLLLMKYISRKPHTNFLPKIFHTPTLLIYPEVKISFSKIFSSLYVSLCTYICTFFLFSENVYRHVGKAIACLLLLLKEKQTCDLELFILIELLCQEKHLYCSSG